MADEKLSPREREIMDALFIAGEATATEIQSAIKTPLANATVRTILRVLERKGHVRHRLDERRFVYRPVQSRQQHARAAMKRMVRVFYEDSITQTVNGLLQLGERRLSEDEWAELSALVEEAKERHRK